MSVKLIARVMGEDESTELGEFSSLSDALEWVKDEEGEGGARSEVELYCTLPDGEKIELDHDDRWFRRVETTDEGTWRTLCSEQRLTVVAFEVGGVRQYSARERELPYRGSFNGVRGHVECRLTDEEVSRER